MSNSDGTLVQSIASAVSEARDEIARRWLERVAERVAVEKEFVFPSENLLDEVPLLINGIARHLADDTHELSVDLPVVLKARELGHLRHEQGFSARQILWEYEILALIILQFIDDLDGIVAGSARPPEIARRLLRGISTVQRATVEEFVERSEGRVREREERLRGFNHALSHELRNEVGAILAAAEMLREPFVQDDELKRKRFLRMVTDNAQRIDVLVANLLELARLDLDTRRNRNVLLPHAAQEVARRLRSFADSHGVLVEVATDLPRLEVNAAAVDFCLTNLLANAVKYHDPEQSSRWVRVRATISQRAENDDVAVIEVLDNGRGVPEADRPYLFERFFRSTNAAGQEGTGLGLTLVRDVIERLGGRIWAEFPGHETQFVFTLPARRVNDRSEPEPLKHPAD